MYTGDPDIQQGPSRQRAPRRKGGAGVGEGHPEQRYATGSVARILAPTAERSSCSSER